MSEETIDITNPGDPVNVTPFSEGEARQITEEIKGGLDSLGEKLLEAHRRRAWEPLGYLNFADYSQNEFGKSRYEANRLLIDARVTSSLRSKFRSEEIKELSVSQKELLVKIPSEQRAEALEEAQQLAQDEGKKKSTAQHVRRVVEERLALPPKKGRSSAGKKTETLMAWHRPEWQGSREFQLDEPSLLVEYSDSVKCACRFDFYACQEGKLLGSAWLDFDEAVSYATPEVAAKYLTKDYLDREDSLEARKNITLEARLKQILEEKEKLEAQIVERDQTIAGLKLQISGTETELNQLKALLAQSTEHIYCGEEFARGLVEVQEAGKTKKPRLLEIAPGSPVFITPDVHSNPDFCYIRPVEAANWLEGILVKRSELKASNQELTELQAENEDLKGRISYLLDERGLAQAKANDDARIEIERLQKLNDQLERENIQLDKVYTESEVLSQKHFRRVMELQAQLDTLTEQAAALGEGASLTGEPPPPEVTVSRFDIGQIKTRSELERFCSRRQMDEARRNEEPLTLSDGSVWRLVSRDGNETLWRDLGHRSSTSLFECISLEELPKEAPDNLIDFPSCT